MKPKIVYPCEWEYRIIGMDEDTLRNALKEVLGERPYCLESSHRSRCGKYISMILTIFVETESLRNHFFCALRDHKAVKVVI